ncbi:MAG: L,D-transpeptidase [Chitinophagales bacterium]|nr:L,D-transpeptidase [Chitinophagales bacterium]
MSSRILMTIKPYIFILPLLLALLMGAYPPDDNSLMTEPMVTEYLNRLEKETDFEFGDTVIFISIARQQLYLIRGNSIIKRYSISSSKNGLGCVKNSNQTPFGIHRISEKIGHKSKAPYIYSSRVNTKRKAKLITQPKDTKYDLVTSRILWLYGLEEGINCGGDVDSHERYIYIHGTSEEGLVGSLASEGCIRMLNKDVIQLYTLTPLYTYVVIMNDVPSMPSTALSH